MFIELQMSPIGELSKGKGGLHMCSYEREIWVDPFSVTSLNRTLPHP